MINKQQTAELNIMFAPANLILADSLIWQLDSVRHGEHYLRICEALDCNIEDIMERILIEH